MQTYANPDLLSAGKVQLNTIIGRPSSQQRSAAGQCQGSAASSTGWECCRLLLCYSSSKEVFCFIIEQMQSCSEAMPPLVLWLTLLAAPGVSGGALTISSYCSCTDSFIFWCSFSNTTWKCLSSHSNLWAAIMSLTWHLIGNMWSGSLLYFSCLLGPDLHLISR